MPGFATHYVFGREAYQKLRPSSLKKNLYKNRGAYGLGLQGPDFFFYFLPSYLFHGKNAGSIAHTTETQKFFRALLESRNQLKKKEDLEIADAYLIGFLGHYTLDTVCHPYVYGRTHYPGHQANDYFSRHAYLETDIDNALLESRLHLTPHTFRGERTIALTFHQQWLIASMLCYAYRQTFPRLHVSRLMLFFAIYSMQLGLILLHDKSGQKKVLFRWSEKHFLGYPLFSPLISNNKLSFRSDPFNRQHKNWTNPWDDSRSSNDSFYELYEKAEVLYLRRMKKLVSYLHYDTANTSETKEQLLHTFFADYGNLSFHSGLDASIPS